MYFGLVGSFLIFFSPISFVDGFSHCDIIIFWRGCSFCQKMQTLVSFWVCGRVKFSLKDELWTIWSLESRTAASHNEPTVQIGCDLWHCPSPVDVVTTLPQRQDICNKMVTVHVCTNHTGLLQSRLWVTTCGLSQHILKLAFILYFECNAQQVYCPKCNVLRRTFWGKSTTKQFCFKTAIEASTQWDTHWVWKYLKLIYLVFFYTRIKCGCIPSLVVSHFLYCKLFYICKDFKP